MLRLVPRKDRRRNRLSASNANIAATESSLEERRVLSAVTASADYVDPTAVTAEISESANLEIMSAHKDSVQARIVNGQETDAYEAVGVVNGGCTGTLIAADVVLTAAHCVESENGGFIGDQEGTFEVNGQLYKTTKVTVHPNYDPNNFSAGFDIAIMKLDRPVDGITPHDINREVPTVGQTLTLVGFGESGKSTSGSNNDFGNKHVGETQIDTVTENHVSWQFDSHNESNTAPGDSGGPAFLDQNGKLVVAGITSGGDGDAHQLGDFSFDTRVDTLASWVDQVVGQTGGGGDDGSGGGGDDGGGNDGDGGDGDGGNGANSGTFGSTGAVIIPSDILSTVTSTAVVSGLGGNINDVNVTLNIQHTWNEDLTVTLISPSGTRIELFDGVGEDNDNFVNTTLDDEANQNLENGRAPFTGTFRPTGNLSQLNDESPNGVWTLEVQDHFEDDGGEVTGFEVSITTDATDGDSGGGDSDGGGDDSGDDLNTLATRIDQLWDLDTSGNYFENWGGRGEKWMTSNEGWVFITPDGSVFHWTGDGAEGELIATLSPAYHDNPEQLHDAYDRSNSDSGSGDDLSSKAIQVDQEYELRTTGDDWEDWSGRGEKWMFSNLGWMFITPEGVLFQANGNDDGSDRLISTFSSEYHQSPSLLYNAFDDSQRNKRSYDDLFAGIGSGDDDLLWLNG